MDIFSQFTSFLTENRLFVNLIAIHAVLGVILVTSILLRKLLINGSAQLLHWLGLNWLDGMGKQAVCRLRSLLFWTTLGLMGTTIVSGIGFHLGGFDVNQELGGWYATLSAKQLLGFASAAGELILLAAGVTIALRTARAALVQTERYALVHWPRPGGFHLHLENAPVEENAQSAQKLAQDEHIRHWFFLLERFVLLTIVLTGVWVGGIVVGANEAVDRLVIFLIRVFAVLMIARLMTLACRTVSHSLARLGNRHLGSGQFHRYWDRVTRLFPFGEKCFDAAVYISAASLIIRQLESVPFIANYGSRTVHCIGIFFVTQVLIELFQVLVGEAFGIYNEDQPVNQKALTLLPLLQSIGQYVLYFGSGIMMLRAFDQDIMPLLTAAGILGLTVGLGAQSLVTDVVSGFFILFENQYLVGDVVQIGDAMGRVEAVSIRHTQIRDEFGKLYILPNGTIKTVINYSKGFVNAVVDLKVPATTNLNEISRDMMEAGRRLKQARREVLADTVIKGLVELTPGDMTVRSVTRVMPGTHLTMQCEFRRLLKEVFDERRFAQLPKLAA